jgi:hypothetical protein
MTSYSKCKSGAPCAWHGGKVKFTSHIRAEYKIKQLMEKTANE